MQIDCLRFQTLRLNGLNNLARMAVDATTGRRFCVRACTHITPWEDQQRTERSWMSNYWLITLVLRK